MASEESCGPVLIVDPDASTRREAARLLADAGLHALGVASGEECLSQARRNPPSLVVIEVDLPRLSGYEVCRELREEFGERLPILFMSGDRVEPRDRVAGLFIGGDDYVAKPFHAGEFLARVASLLRRMPPAHRAPDGLTHREREVLQLLSEGLSQSAIARTLVISPRTVGTHIQNIL